MCWLHKKLYSDILLSAVWANKALSICFSVMYHYKVLILSRLIITCVRSLYCSYLTYLQSYLENTLMGPVSDPLQKKELGEMIML